MSSGFGVRGTEGRCYQFWREAEKCAAESEIAGQCGEQVEDYLECLHQKKQITRRNAVYLTKEKQRSKVSVPLEKVN